MKMNVLLERICVIQMQNVRILLVHTLVIVDMDFLEMDRHVLKSTNVLMDLINVVQNLCAPITMADMTAVVQLVMTKKVVVVPFKTSVLATHVQLAASA